MKLIYASILLALLAIPHAADAQKKYFISPTGNDRNNGSRMRPFASWDYVNVLVKDGRLTPGDTVFIRGGVYTSNYGDAEKNHVLWRNIHGSPEGRICIMAFPGETPILGLDDINTTEADPTGIKIEECSYLHIAGLRVSGLNQVADGSGLSCGVDISHTNNSIFEKLEIDNIGGYGLVLGDDALSSLFLNIDVHHIYDSLTNKSRWSNANGIHCIAATAGQDTFRFCRVWKCSNDGFDLNQSTGNFVLEGCWSFWNGYKPYSWDAAGGGSGFKIGREASRRNKCKKSDRSIRLVNSCMAFENRQVGFNQDNGASSFALSNNTSFQNGDDKYGCGFTCEGVRSELVREFRNNISFKDPQPARGAASGMNNSWNVAYEISAKDFISVSSQGVDGYRLPDGNLPALPFLHLKDDSALKSMMACDGVASTGTQ